MADAEKKTLERIGKLHTKRRELMAQVHELDEELGRVLAGEIGIGDVLKDLERGMSRTWEVRYKTPYIWQYVKDRPNLKRLLKTLSPIEIQERWAAYLRDDDPYYVKARHPFALFVPNVNRYAEASTAAEFNLEPPADCRHQPPCRSDQEHTSRRTAEMRG